MLRLLAIFDTLRHDIFAAATPPRRAIAMSFRHRFHDDAASPRRHIAAADC